MRGPDGKREAVARCGAGWVIVHSKRHPDGLTRAEAEAAFGRVREQVAIERAAERESDAKRAAEERHRTLAQVGDAVIVAKRAAGRKPSTIEAYSYWLRIHIIDYFGPIPLGRSHATTCVGSPRRSNARGWRPSLGQTRSGHCIR